MAKHILQSVDYAQTQVVEHLFKLHMFMEPMCVCMHRNLAKLHPLHHLLKHHCRGLIGTNSFGTPFLMAKDGSINSLLTVGRNGSQVMMARAYKEISWDDTDFLDNIKVGKKYILTDRYRLDQYLFRYLQIPLFLSFVTSQYYEKGFKNFSFKIKDKSFPIKHLTFNSYWLIGSRVIRDILFSLPRIFDSWDSRIPM